MERNTIVKKLPRSTIVKKLPQDPPLGHDLLWGADAIAQHLGMKPAQIFYCARKGSLPIKKVGERLVASKSALRRHFQQEG